MSDQSTKPIQILRVRRVASRMDVSKSSVYKLVREGKFPRGLKIGERAVGWLETDVDNWIEARAKNASVAIKV